MMAKNKKMSEAYVTGALLAMVGGYLDAYTYIGRGHVFANAQTGNIVLLGIKIAAGEWEQSLHYLAPVVSFFLGILVAEMIKSKYRKNAKIQWRQVIIILEVFVLTLVAFIPEGNEDTLANILISFVCSLQVEGFRTMNGKVYATTMCTGNLRSATEKLYDYKQTRDRQSLQDSLQYYGIILFFILGALIGSFVTNIFAVKAVLFGSAGLTVVFFLMFIKYSPKSR